MKGPLPSQQSGAALDFFAAWWAFNHCLPTLSDRSHFREALLEWELTLKTYFVSVWLRTGSMANDALEASVKF